MALVNPNIAMSFRMPEFQAPNALAQYAQLQQIQGGRQAQELAQLQMQQVQREQESTNALNRAYAEAYNAQTGEIDVNKLRGSLSTGGFGSKLPGLEKSLSELAQQKLTQEKLKGEVAAQPTTLAAAQAKLLDDKLKQSRGFLETIDPTSPGAADAYMQWHRANHADPVIGKALEARGITVDQSMQRIQQLMQTPGGLARLINESKLGTEKFMEMNKPQLSTTDLGGQVMSRTFQPLTGELTTIGTQTKTPTIGERTAQSQLALAREKFNFDQTNAGQSVTYQQDANGNIVALPTKVKPGDTPRGRTVAAPGQGMLPMAGKPSEAAAKETASLAQQNAIIAGALDAIKKNPNAFGTARGVAGGVLGETIGARAVGETPEETQARSFLFNVVSGVIKERAGTAQSAGEQATLNRFLPTTTDNADELTSKLKGFQDYLTARESAGKKPGGGNPPPSANVVITPDGQSHTFPNAAAAAQFKKAVGL